ncbi:hypothetical protein MSMAT_1345 [Methanosarcina mazei TMA]|uniref:Uncharacterized protein n=2 Tax=Methanosarcina mazei TaxID=2209 RepID=M1QCL7_METMZ|nr:hypothetical protein MmTuc01_2673 [Methanosarcina mazei Tuc01]AKB70909.1 hypothetical protein MSMAC_1019 [Methanosarcina mazei C16]UWJ22602.1 hypothetical protein MSMAT_1345 [Methanosarcina mazei TMA]
MILWQVQKNHSRASIDFPPDPPLYTLIPWSLLNTYFQNPVFLIYDNGKKSISGDSRLFNGNFCAER